MLDELTSRQAGALSRHQALGSGMTRDAVKWAVRRGAWQQIYPGVYATFTGQVGRPTRLWAALLYAGEAAVLSHGTAAELLGLTNRISAPIHVTVPHGERVVPPAGLVIHQTRHAMPRWRFARGIPPHTMAEDTVIDLINAAIKLDEAVGWVTAAFARRLTSERMLRQALAERPFRYDRDVERAHGLPPSEVQAPFAKGNGRRGFRDRYYGQYGRLVIELDGRQYHPDEGRDRVRDNQAAAGGGATLRYDWTAVTQRPCETAAEVFQALSERGFEGAITPCGQACRLTRGVVSGGGWPPAARY